MRHWDRVRVMKQFQLFEGKVIWFSGFFVTEKVQGGMWNLLRESSSGGILQDEGNYKIIFFLR